MSTIYFQAEGSSIRVDYDLALARLSYPVADPWTGLTLLHGNKFNKTSVMPICLPHNKNFRDTDRFAVSVGMGITSNYEKLM